MIALGDVKAVASEHPTGEFEVVLSAPTLDRDGEIIDAKSFEPLPDHITFDVDHGMSTSTTVGSGVPYYDGDILKVKGTFSSIPRAQEVRTLVNEGHIRTTSVAFMAAERAQKDGAVHITRAELLNGAFVPIPSNRQAVVLSAKSYVERITAQPPSPQDIHDLAVASGATCDYKTATPDEAPGTAAAPAVKSPASVVAQARLEAARACLLLTT